MNIDATGNSLQKARDLKKELVSWRREFHSNPELGFKEIRTSARIADIMTEMGYQVRRGVGRTGVLAEKGAGSPVVAIRADMDALPIHEANDTNYVSKNPGVMHACGHDAHMTIALGTARLFADTPFPGTLRFLFQPSEEVGDDEGISGAPRMIADGAMESVQTVLALHVDSSYPAGEITLKSGVASAGVDTFYGSVIGKGGHGAKPHEVVDPIYLSGLVILALHGIVSRRLHPFDPAVVSIGTIHGGQIDNVIPDQVELSGTLRFMESDVQHIIHTEVEHAFSIARNLGGDYRLRFEIGYPPMFNNPTVVETIRNVARPLLGAEHIHTPKMEMGAEDFGFMTALAPGAMFTLGCARPGEERKLHSPTFDIDEECLPVGVAVMTQTALAYLTGSV